MNEDSLLARGSPGATTTAGGQHPGQQQRGGTPRGTPSHQPVRFNPEVTTVDPRARPTSPTPAVKYGGTGSGLEASGQRMSRRLADVVLVDKRPMPQPGPPSPQSNPVTPGQVGRGGTPRGGAFSSSERLLSSSTPLGSPQFTAESIDYGGGGYSELDRHDTRRRQDEGNDYGRDRNNSMMAVDGMAMSFRDVVMVKRKSNPFTALCDGVFQSESRPQLLVQQACGYFDAGTLNVIGGIHAENADALLDALCGRRPPMTGTVLANGLPVATSTFRRIVGFVGRTRAAIEMLTVGQNITFSAEMRSASFHDRRSENGAVCRDNVDIVMTMMGFAKDIPVDSLNEIGKIKLELAMELVLDPPVIFLRQPLAELPSHQVQEFVELLRRAARYLNKTVIMSSTSFPMPLWERLDNLLVLGRDGHTMFSGPRERLTAYFLTLKLSPYCLLLSHDHMDRASRTSLGFNNLWADPGSLVHPWGNKQGAGGRNATETSGASDGEDPNGGRTSTPGRARRVPSGTGNRERIGSGGGQQPRRGGSPVHGVNASAAGGASNRSSGFGRQESDVVNSILTPKRQDTESPDDSPSNPGNGSQFPPPPRISVGGLPPPSPASGGVSPHPQQRSPTPGSEAEVEQQQGSHRDFGRWLVVSDGDVALDVIALWADREDKEAATTRYAAAFYDSKDRNHLMNKLEENQRMGARAAVIEEYGGGATESPTMVERERRKTNTFNFAQMLHQPPKTSTRFRALLMLHIRRAIKSKDLLLATVTLFFLFAFAAWVMHRQNSDQQGMQNTRGIMFFMFWVVLELNIYFIQTLMEDINLFLHHRDGGYYNLGLFMSTLFLRLLLQRIVMLVPLAIFIFFILASLNELMFLLGLCSLAHASLVLLMATITHSTTTTTFVSICIDAYMVIFSGFLYNLKTLPIAVAKTSLIRFGYGGAVHHDLRNKPWACDQNKFAPTIANLTTNQTSYCYTGDQYIESQGFQDDSLNGNSLQLFVIMLILLILCSIRLSMMLPV